LTIAVEYEAVKFRDNIYAVRPKGQKGTKGSQPVPWQVTYVSAKSPEQAVEQAMAKMESNANNGAKS
jgi:hypothetical protein